MFVFKSDSIGDYRVWCRADADVDYSGDFPELENYTHSLGEEDHPTWSCQCCSKSRDGN